MSGPAVVVFSGGLDSTVCLAWAKVQFGDVHAVAVDYAQRNRVELEQARLVAEACGAPLTVVDLRGYGALMPSAITRAGEEYNLSGGLFGMHSAFVPGRNLVFAMVAACYGLTFGSRDVVLGVRQVSDACCPDSRRDSMEALERLLAVGNGLERFHVHTPLMFTGKAEAVRMAERLGATHLLALSHTCWHDARPACGVCPACSQRLAAFTEAGVPDPLDYAPLAP